MPPTPLEALGPLVVVAPDDALEDAPPAPVVEEAPVDAEDDVVDVSSSHADAASTIKRAAYFARRVDMRRAYRFTTDTVDASVCYVPEP